MSLSRRALLASGAALLPLLVAARAGAVPRPRFGGRLRLTLPVPTHSLDPHDGEDLTNALLGRNVFEPLFAWGDRGQAYPTLADGLPRVVGSRLHVQLRPDLTSALGRALDGKAVVASLVRAQKDSPLLLGGVPPRVEGTQALSFAGGDPEALARRLAHADAALVPTDFRASAPDGCGAFSVRVGSRTLALLRNDNAARGPSYLDGAEIVAGELSECLRAFESGESDLGWLGLGLHQPRPGAVPFRFEALGLVVVLGGRGLGSWGAPGALQATLASTTSRALDSLGYVRSEAARSGAAPSLPPRQFSLLFPDDCVQLAATAQALAEAWSSRGTTLIATAEPREVLLARRASGDFDLLLAFRRTAGLATADVHAALLRLDQKVVPAQLHAEAPELLARRLRLGILGALAPSGAHAPLMGQLVSGSQLNLADVQRVTPQ